MTGNVAASVHQRLLNLSRSQRKRFNDLLQHYALERWIYRLSVSDHADLFVLKGALMLPAWGLPASRPTKDIDMLARATNDLESIRQVIADICEQRVEDDGLIFRADSVTTHRIAEDALYDGVRSKFGAFLGNATIAMQVDLGFSDVVTPGPVSIVYPTIFDQTAPTLMAYNQETAIAEKLEAMVKLGELNSRMKDFFDVWSLASSQDFVGTTLSEAIAQTFANRNTPRSSDAVCFTSEFGESDDKQKQWRAFVRRSQLSHLAPEQFSDVWHFVMTFVGPMMKADEDNLIWSAGGPWVGM